MRILNNYFASTFSLVTSIYVKSYIFLASKSIESPAVIPPAILQNFIAFVPKLNISSAELAIIPLRAVVSVENIML